MRMPRNQYVHHHLSTADATTSLQPLRGTIPPTACRAIPAWVALLGILSICNSADAAVTYGVTLTGTPGQLVFDRNNTFGWRFQPNTDIAVTALGYFDVSSLPGGSGAGLSQSHNVGIFAPDTTLLAVVTIPAGTTADLFANYRYVDLPSPTALTAGVTYTIGAFCLSGSLDAMPAATGFTFTPQITYQNPGGVAQYIVNVHGNPPSELSCPQLPVTGTLPAFAANFRFSTACPLSGDMNGDGIVDGGDIETFVQCTLTGNGDCNCASMSVAEFIVALLG